VDTLLVLCQLISKYISVLLLESST
jgi:hypothetical protein